MSANIDVAVEPRAPGAASREQVILASVSNPHAAFTGSVAIDIGSPSRITLVLEDGISFCVPDDHIIISRGVTVIHLDQAPVGYHRIVAELRDGGRAAWSLFVHPRTCYLPDVAQSERALSVQLYAVRSKRNWGIGDFTDLAGLMRNARGHYDYVGVNPLHALHPDDPEDASPYAPDSRLLFNEIYIDVVAAARSVGAFAVIETLGANKKFMASLARARRANLVQYRTVYNAKLLALAKIFSHWMASKSPAPEAIEGFFAFISDFDPLARRVLINRARNRRANDGADLGKAVLFEFFLQWICTSQIERATTADGPQLYFDLAVGAAQKGSDMRVFQSYFDIEKSLGAEPDQFCVLGQRWNVAPFNVAALRRDGYRLFRAIVTGNMKHAGALRIDHIAGFMRPFVMPVDRDATAGDYRIAPFEEFLAVIAIESHRAGCIVIGEDLGRVPPQMRETMRKWDVLGCLIYVLEDANFERGGVEPDRAQNGLFSFGTHDCAPFVGYLTGKDVEINKALNRIELETAQSARAERARIAKQLIADGPFDGDTGFDCKSVLNGLAKKFGSRINGFSIDDLIGEELPVNMPGTDQEYANWRRRYHVQIEPRHFALETG